MYLVHGTWYHALVFYVIFLFSLWYYPLYELKNCLGASFNLVFCFGNRFIKNFFRVCYQEFTKNLWRYNFWCSGNWILRVDNVHLCFLEVMACTFTYVFWKLWLVRLCFLKVMACTFTYVFWKLWLVRSPMFSESYGLYVHLCFLKVMACTFTYVFWKLWLVTNFFQVSMDFCPKLLAYNDIYLISLYLKWPNFLF